MIEQPIAFFYGEGGPSPTIVLTDDNLFNKNIDELEQELTRIMNFVYHNFRNLNLKCCPTKIALIRPSKDKNIDLDYFFIQVTIVVQNKELFHFDFKGNCGHSLVAAIARAMWGSLIPMKSIVQEITVSVLNTNSIIRFNVNTSQIPAGKLECNVKYSVPINQEVFPRKSVNENIVFLGRKINFSVVNAGNPYILIDATAFNINNEHQLFSSQDHLIPYLLKLRKKIGESMGYKSNSVFPKIALVLKVLKKDGSFKGVAVRSIYINDWHPGIGITGLVCLGASINIPNTVIFDSESGERNLYEIIHSTGAVKIQTICNEYFSEILIPNKNARMILPPISFGVLNERSYSQNEKQTFINA